MCNTKWTKIVLLVALIGIIITGYSGCLQSPDTTVSSGSSGGNTFGSTIPDVTTNAASGITANSAILGASVNPNGLPTETYFEWGTTTAYGSSSIPQFIGEAISNVSITVAGLVSNVTYNFRAVATNSAGATNGNNQVFNTVAPSAPSVATTAATNITANSATLNGTVNPNGFATNYYFQWGQTTAYGNSTTSQSTIAGTTNVAASANLTSLNPTTTYNFRLIAQNSAGTITGSNQAFTTSSGGGGSSAPTATTDPATNIASNSTTLNGTVNPNGLDTTVIFEWGIPGVGYSFNSSQTPIAVGSGTTAVSVSVQAGSLNPSTNYNFRVVATNSIGTTNGSAQVFTTSP